MKNLNIPLENQINDEDNYSITDKISFTTDRDSVPEVSLDKLEDNPDSLANKISYIDTIPSEEIQIRESYNMCVNEQYKDKILSKIKANGGYCPCVVERTESQKCPCNDYLNYDNCHCNLYVQRISNICIYMGEGIEENIPYLNNRQYHPEKIIKESILFILKQKNLNFPIEYNIYTNESFLLSFLYNYSNQTRTNISFYLNNKLLKKDEICNAILDISASYLELNDKFNKQIIQINNLEQINSQINALKNDLFTQNINYELSRVDKQENSMKQFEIEIENSKNQIEIKEKEKIKLLNTTNYENNEFLNKTWKLITEK
jgi:ferredoxin-thioredoxin reductase catalytic subunit